MVLYLGMSEDRSVRGVFSAFPKYIAEKILKDGKVTSVKIKSLFPFLLLLSLFWVGQKWKIEAADADEIRIHVDVSKNTGKLSPLWRPSAYLTGLGEGSDYIQRYHSILHDERLGEFLHPDAFLKWKREIGFNGGIFRIKFKLLPYRKETFPSRKDRAILDIYEAIIRDVIDGGGIPLLTFAGMPYSISSNPTRKGRPTYPPSDYSAWREYVSDIVSYFSIERGYGNIWYHIRWEPNTSLWENRYQKELYKNRFPGMHVTKFWRGSRFQFFDLYKAAVEGIESVERKHDVKLTVGGVNIQELGRWDMGDPRSFPEAFVKYCQENKLRLDFFSYRIVQEDVGLWSNHFRGLLDQSGYRETKLVVVDWTTSCGVIGENAIGRTHRGIERDNEIQAVRIPSLIAEMEEAGVDRQCMESMQDWDVPKYLHGYPLFKKQIGTAFTVGNVIKPAFNVCKMLSLLGEERLDARVEGAENIGVVATRSDEKIAILFWYYVNPSAISRGAIDMDKLRAKIPGQEARIEVNGLSEDKQYLYRRVLVDMEHSNSYFHKEKILRVLLGMNKDEQINMSEYIKSKKNLHFPKEEIQRNAGRINNWEEINLQKVEEKKIITGSYFKEKIHMEPFSVHLITLEMD